MSNKFSWNPDVHMVVHGLYKSYCPVVEINILFSVACATVGFKLWAAVENYQSVSHVVFL